MQVPQKPPCHQPGCNQQSLMFMKNDDGSDNFLCWQCYAKLRNMKPTLTIKLQKNEEEDTYSI